MAGGLSPNQLRALLQEHGSWEAAIEARPDLADQLRGVQRMAKTIGGQVEAVKRMTAIETTLTFPRTFRTGSP
jgi:hypothetical protein